MSETPQPNPDELKQNNVDVHQPLAKIVIKEASSDQIGIINQSELADDDTFGYDETPSKMDEDSSFGFSEISSKQSLNDSSQSANNTSRDTGNLDRFPPELYPKDLKGESGPR